MAVNPTKLQNDLNTAIKDAASKAYKKTFEVSSDENESVETMKTKVSNEFGKQLASELAPDLAKILVAMVKTITATPILANGSGPVTGTIVIS